MNSYKTYYPTDMISTLKESKFKSTLISAPSLQKMQAVTNPHKGNLALVTILQYKKD